MQCACDANKTFFLLHFFKFYLFSQIYLLLKKKIVMYRLREIICIISIKY